MKNLLKLTLVLFAVSFMATSLKSQQKYAVIIIGDKPISTGSYVQANFEDEVISYDEFWNDTYLIWELLIQNGFSNEYIYVLYDEGNDYIFDEQVDRYKAGYNYEEKVTDYAVNKTEIENVFTGLATGSNGFPQLTQDDFLFVYTFSHGYSTTAIPEDPGVEHTLLALPGYNELMDYDHAHSLSDIELGNYLENISAVKKLIIMSQCLSGGFILELEGDNVIISTAANDYMPAKTADKRYYLGIINWNDPTDVYHSVEDEYEMYENDETEHRYRHTEYNLHLLSALKGKMPDDQSDSYVVPDYQDFPLSDADINSDNIISITEAFDWVILFDSWRRYYAFGHDDPKLSHSNDLANYTSLQYPTLMFENIGPIGGLIVEQRGIIGITKDVHIESSNQLTFLNNADVYLLNDVKLIVDAGATLIIEDNVVFHALGGDCKLVIDGDVTIGSNVSFIADEGVLFSVYLNNNLTQANITNAIFERCRLISNCTSLNIENSTFTDCYRVSSYLGDVTVTNSDFDETGIYLQNYWTDYDFTATVDNCTFINGNYSIIGIDIWNYSNYFISNNTIDGYHNGIEIWDSGKGASDNQEVFNNDVSNCLVVGILSYSSTTSIYDNYVHDNYVGIALYNYGHVDLTGNPGAPSNEKTQRILDNESYEIYSSDGSFPWYMRHNVIIDEDNGGNPDDPLVYYELRQGTPTLDVRYNCWSNSTNFDPMVDLFPAELYIVDPTWCPGGGSIVQEAAETLYLSGKQQYDSSDYTSAKSTFEMVVSQYPITKYASASMKDLFTIEQFVANDYGALQQYYNTDPVIQADSILMELAIFLSNKCDVEMENWQPAITHYEDIITNPPSPDDSIFAIIDLGHTYLLMENSGSRSPAVGNMLEHKPKSESEYKEKRDYLLSLLPMKKDNENNYNFNPFEGNVLLQNYPNPLNSNTIIYFQLKEQSEGYVIVFNLNNSQI